MAGAAAQADPPARTTGLRALLLWPWLLGSVVLVLLSLPVPHPVVLAYLVLPSLTLRRAYAVAQRAPIQPDGSAGLLRPRWALLAALVVAAGFRLLAQGVAL